MEALGGSQASNLVFIFMKIFELLSERTSVKDKWGILLRLYLQSTFIIDKHDGDFLPPTAVLAETMKKLEKSKEKTNLDKFRDVFSEILDENNWETVGPPRQTRTIYALTWAAVANEETDNISKIALRNFLEIAFWMPMNLGFYVDVNSFLVRKSSIVELILRSELLGTWNTRLGQLIYRHTQKVIAAAKELKNDPFGEERFILHELPSLASDYVQELVEDSRTKNPQLFQRKLGNY